MARSRQCGRTARRPALAQLSDRGGRKRPPIGASGLWRSRGRNASPALRHRTPRSGCRPNACCNSKLFGRTRGLTPRLFHRRMRQRPIGSPIGLAEILRGRLEGLGPVTQTALASPLGLEPEAITVRCRARSEGAFSGDVFSPVPMTSNGATVACSPAFIITTIRRLRSEIEPVAARDFLRFLFAWQHVSEDARLEGSQALPVALAALEGFEAPARAWETEILPARLKGYEPAWLDAHCLAGRCAWTRLTPPPPQRNGRAREAPGACDTHRLARSPAGAALDVTRPARRRRPVRARKPCLTVCTRKAPCFSMNWPTSHLLRPQAEEALSELVALGLATSDSFGGLRALWYLPPNAHRFCRRKAAAPASLLRNRERRPLVDCLAVLERRERKAPAAAIEHVARALLAAMASCFGAFSRGARMAAALARFVPRLSADGSARRNSRRPFRRRLLRRAIRAAGRGWTFARYATPARVRPMGVAVCSGPAQSDRHPDPRPEAFGSDRQPARLSRRPAGRSLYRR